MSRYLFRPTFNNSHFRLASLHLRAPNPFPANHPIFSSVMAYRPNYQGGGRRGASSSAGRGAGRRGGGGGRGGRGEQRWWDPVWRAERLRQQQAEVNSNQSLS